MIQEIYEKLGLTSDLDKEKEKVFRRLLFVFQKVNNQLKIGGKTSPILNTLYDYLAFTLGGYRFDNLATFIEEAHRDTFEEIFVVATLTLEKLKIENFSVYDDMRLRLKEAIDLSLVDLGITLENDIFIKTGSKELDNVAIIEPLDWLGDYPTAKHYFENALEHYLKKNHSDAITNAYSALESLVKTVLNSNRSLNNLITDLVRWLSLPNQWGTILIKYCDFAHEFSTRHGKKEGKTKDLASEKDTEAYIYFSGLMIRLIIRTIAEKE